MVSHTGIEPVTPWLKVKCSTDWANGSYFGAGDEGRTRDIQLGRLTLYQLSYSRIIWFVVPRAGLEPARDKFPQDFKSCASTDFATKAYLKSYFVYLWQLSQYNINLFVCQHFFLLIKYFFLFYSSSQVLNQYTKFYIKCQIKIQLILKLFLKPLFYLPST